MEPLGVGDPREVGRFRLRARLGAGGMGRVYLGSSPAGRAVAVKVVHAELAANGEFVRRFTAEVAAARMVSGLYTAPVVAAGTDDDPPWLATAYVPAPSLDELVGMAGPLPLPALWRLAAGVAEALEAIHGCGLVHRDLKPGNVLIAADGPQVIDFGIARALEATALTSTGVVIGTVGYMPPEQVTGGEARPAGDVFSLGCVLAFAATGAHPFAPSPGTPAATVLYRVAHGTPDLEGVPDPLRGLVAHCLSRDPAGRPTPGEVAARAAALGEDPEPGAFWPPTVVAAIDGWQARHPLPPPPAPESPAAPPEPPQPQPAAAHPATASAGEPAVDVAAAASAAARDTVSVAMPAPAAMAPGPPQAEEGGEGAGSDLGSPAGREVSRRLLLVGLGGAAAVAAAAYAGISLAGGGSPRSSLPRASAGSLSSSPAPRPAPSSRAPASQARPTPIASLKPGEQAWAFQADGGVSINGLAVAGGTVYFYDQNGMGYAVDATSGRKLWTQVSVGTPGEFSGPPVATSGIVCFQVGFGNDATSRLAAFDAATGKPAWETPSETPYSVQGWAADGGKIYFTTANGELSVRDATTGKQLPGPLASDGFAGPMTVSDGIVYAMGSELVALRASDGAILWRNTDTSGVNVVYAVVSGGVVYVTTANENGKMYALDAATGLTRWAYPSVVDVNVGIPVLGSGFVYVVDEEPVLHAIHASTGRLAWKADVYRYAPPPATSPGAVYIQLDENNISALSAGSGSTLFIFNPSSSLIASAVATAGDLVYVAIDESILAVRAAAGPGK